MSPQLSLLTAAGSESQAHADLKRSAAEWLWKAGFREIATEVPLISAGAIVDTLAARDRMPAGQLSRFLPEPPRGGMGVSLAVEVKVNRGDFVRDLKRHDGPEYMVLCSEDSGKYQRLTVAKAANLLYLVTPKGLVTPDEVPAPWGLIEVRRGRFFHTKRARWQKSAGECSSAIAEKYTRDLFKAEERAEAKLLRDAQKARPQCRWCIHFDGPRRKEKGKRHTGICSLLGRQVSGKGGTRGNPLCWRTRHGLSFERHGG